MNKDFMEALPLATVGAMRGAWEYYKPELMWGTVLGSIALYDTLCPPGETLSEAADKAIEKHPLITRMLIGVTALHLANLLPDKIDPIARTFKLMKGTS